MGTMFAQVFATITMFFSALHKFMSAADKYAGIAEGEAEIQFQETALKQEIRRIENNKKVAAARAANKLTAAEAAEVPAIEAQ